MTTMSPYGASHGHIYFSLIEIKCDWISAPSMYGTEGFRVKSFNVGWFVFSVVHRDRRDVTGSPGETKSSSEEMASGRHDLGAKIEKIKFEKMGLSYPKLELKIDVTPLTLVDPYPRHVDCFLIRLDFINRARSFGAAAMA